MDEWVETLCEIAARRRTEGKSVLELFQAAAPALDDRQAFLTAIAAALRHRPDLVDEWLSYSSDKRTDRGPYVAVQSSPNRSTTFEVGFFDAHVGRSNVRTYTDQTAACADFVYREAVSVLKREHAG